jgi:hypothetical protein
MVRDGSWLDKLSIPGAVSPYRGRAELRNL